MIDKMLVEQIIRKIDAVKEKRLPKTCVDSPTQFAWSEEKRKVADTIAALPREELYDLAALMDYGREQSLAGPRRPYTEVREDICRSFKDEDSRHIADHLLKKRDLSGYLRAAMSLFDLDGFKF